MSHPIILAKRIPEVIYIQHTRYVQVASLALVIYDHLLTLPKEIDMIWRGTTARSWPRLLFFASRYVPPIALAINASALMGTHSKNVYAPIRLYCIPVSLRFILPGRGWLLFHGWTGYAFFAGIQVISQMRLWAMYRSRSLLVFMPILTAMALIIMGIIEGLGYTHVQVTPAPIPNILVVCGPGPLPPYVYIFWLPPILIEIVSVVLVIYKAAIYFQEDTPKESAATRVMTSLVRHSAIYFVAVLAVYIADFYVWKRLPFFAFELFIPLTYALPAVTANRMLLALRSVFYTRHSLLPGEDETIKLTTVNTERGVTIHTHDPLKEFESFFGETTR